MGNLSGLHVEVQGPLGVGLDFPYFTLHFLVAVAIKRGPICSER